MDKQKRQRKILQLINNEAISSQETLRKKLINLGHSVTQATLSRDLRELSIIKRGSRKGEYKYAKLESSKGFSILRCDVSENILVFQTEPGLAPAVAYKVDALKLDGILGTVAGENTLLAVVAEGYDAQDMRMELWRLIQGT